MCYATPPPLLCSSAPAPVQEYLPPDKLAQVRRVLQGANQGGAVRAIELPSELSLTACERNFDLQAYRFAAAAEQLRAPRIVRIGLIQNSIVKPTTAPFVEQRQARWRCCQCIHGPWCCLPRMSSS
jgi:beta-ureidopropionase